MPATRRLLTVLLIAVLPVGSCAALVLAALFVPVPLLDALRPAPPAGIVRIQPEVRRHVALPDGRLDLTLTGGIDGQTAHVEATAPDGSTSRFDLAAGERHRVAGVTIESIRTWHALDARSDALYARVDLDTTNGERVRIADRYLESAPRGSLTQLEDEMPWLVPDTGLTSWPYTDWRDTSSLPLWSRAGRTSSAARSVLPHQHRAGFGLSATATV